MEPFERSELSWWMVPTFVVWTAAVVALLMGGRFGIFLLFLLATAAVLAICSHRLVPRTGSDERADSRSIGSSESGFPEESEAIEWIDD